jgi:hypothetical protein
MDDRDGKDTSEKKSTGRQIEGNGYAAGGDKYDLGEATLKCETLLRRAGKRVMIEGMKQTGMIP